MKLFFIDRRWIALFLLSSMMVASVAEAQTTVFTTNLQQGDSSEQVRLLQQALNQDRDTEVVSFGLCSPGHETNYFNVLTKVAVIKFQEKYRAEVLDPLGLPSGTGYVGALTRKKLNALIAASATKASNPSSALGFASPIALPAPGLAPHIDAISPDQGYNGTRITIKGSGFAVASNSVMTTFGVFDGLASPDGKTISFDFKSDIISSIEDPSFGEPDEVDSGYRAPNIGGLPLSIMIRNSNGFSAPTTTFKLLFK